jgi:hypothetical protein
VSRDDLGAYVVRLERENHRLRTDLADLRDELRDELHRAEARARTWRRVAQWIYETNQETRMTAYLITNPPRVRQFRDRGTTPSGVIVVHTAESTPDWVGPDAGAENVARFIADRSDYGSYHDLCDSDSIVNLVPYDMQAYGDGTGSNPHAYHVSAATQAAKWNQTSKEWRDGTVRNMARAAARYARWLEAEHGIKIPASRITRAGSEKRIPGFISHGERDPGRRSDPGADFPWQQFLTYYAEFSNGGDDDMALDDKVNDDRTVRQVLRRLDNFITRSDKRHKAMLAHDRSLTSQLAALRKAVDNNADKAEIKAMLNSLDATIQLVINEES